MSLGNLSTHFVLPPLPSRRCLLALASAAVGLTGRMESSVRLHRCSSNQPLTLALSRKGRGDRAERVIAFFASAVVCMSFAHAQAAPDPVLEARVKALSSELRCLVCQNQTVEDSTAPVARDIKDQVRIQLAAGKSEAEVKAYMTDRFGDFVLYNPPFKATTVVLWAGPFAALLLAGFLLTRRLRKASVAHAPVVLSDEARDRAQALLNSKDVLN